MTSFSIASPDMADADLVANSLAGNRQAYGQIVARYQSLVCSVAYSISGSLQQSEDIAQETFVSAWTQLRDLREPAKLRAWLCTIARNRAYHSKRKDDRRRAEPLDDLPEVASAEPLPTVQTISREEESILWRSQEDIPETYREPMVLFYREQQSVERVASALELTDDTVRQRLYRGRQMLAAQVARFVEGTLASTAPGAPFTQGVMSALPLAMLSAKSVVAGTAAAKSGTAKLLAAGSWAVFLIGPLIGVAGAWYGTKTSIDAARSPRERQFLVRSAWFYLINAGIFIAGMFAISFAASRWWETHKAAIIAATLALSLYYGIVVLVAAMNMNRRMRRIREEDGTSQLSVHPITGRPLDSSFEYRSPWTFLGLPLVHVCTGPFANGRKGVARGWIAIGDIAIGAYACGGMGVGILSFGGVSLGLVSVGGLAMGGLAFGGFAFGAWAIGGVAVGWLASGGVAIAWQAAAGGMALAKEFALGGNALAAHANDDLAHGFARDNWFFILGRFLLQYGLFLVWLPIILVISQARRIRKNMRAKAS